jgi:DNA transposition AAA+ family ATPase
LISGQRRALLVFDEAQHLSIECLETLRKLLDQPPHCGLLFADTHELEEIFTSVFMALLRNVKLS